VLAEDEDEDGRAVVVVICRRQARADVTLGHQGRPPCALKRGVATIHTMVDSSFGMYKFLATPFVMVSCSLLDGLVT